MTSSVEDTLSRAQALVEAYGKTALAAAAGLPYASLHDMLRVGTGNRTLKNLAALERGIAALEAVKPEEAA